MVASNITNGVHWKNIVLWAFSIILPAVCAWVWAVDREVVRLDQIQKARAPAYDSITTLNVGVAEIRTEISGLKTQSEDTKKGIDRVGSQVDKLVEHMLRYDGMAPMTPRNGERR